MEFNAALLALATKLAGLADGLDNGNSSAEEQAARLAHEAKRLIVAAPSAGAEAVAWRCVSPTCNSTAIVQKESHRDEFIRLGREITPLYTAPQPDGRDANQVTLTMQQIKGLAEFTGMAVDSSGFDADEMEGEYAIRDCPPSGLLNDGEPGDPESFSHYAHIVYCVECPEEGCIGLGPNIAALAGPRT